jgi:hypothetical protein
VAGFVLSEGSAPFQSTASSREVWGGSEPRAKEVALTRWRESSDEKLAVFEDRLRDDALDAGASEQEMRQDQRDHPGHGA